jgi:hypothetical protein
LVEMETDEDLSPDRECIMQLRQNYSRSARTSANQYCCKSVTKASDLGHQGTYWSILRMPDAIRPPTAAPMFCDARTGPTAARSHQQVLNTIGNVRTPENVMRFTNVQNQ